MADQREAASVGDCQGERVSIQPHWKLKDGFSIIRKTGREIMAESTEHFTSRVLTKVSKDLLMCHKTSVTFDPFTRANTA